MGGRRAGTKKKGEGEAVTDKREPTPDERKCPIHPELFFVQHTRTTTPSAGPVLQDPVTKTWWGCPQEGYTIRLEVCLGCHGLLDHESSVGPGGSYRPGDKFDLTRNIHHYKCQRCERTFMRSGDSFTETRAS